MPKRVVVKCHECGRSVGTRGGKMKAHYAPGVTNGEFCKASHTRHIPDPGLGRGYHRVFRFVPSGEFIEELASASGVTK